MTEEMNTLKFYRSYFESINELDDEDRLILYDSIMRYQFLGEQPQFENKYLNAIWCSMLPNIEASNKCAIDGKKGGRPPKKTTESENEKGGFLKNKKGGFENIKTEEEVEEDVEVEEEVKDIYTLPSKKQKHKFGEYKHVLLTDDEVEKLKKDYPNYQELINYLDEYIERKGYKAKSHYLCIKKWVVEAVKQDKLKDKPKDFPNKYYNSDVVNLDNLKYYYNFE